MENPQNASQPGIPPPGASPDDVMARMSMVMHFLTTQQWPRLIEVLRPDLGAPDPETRAIAHRMTGKALLRLRRQEEAMEHLRKAQALEPTNPDVLWLLAVCHYETGKPLEGLPLIRRAIEMQPDRGDFWLALASLHHLLGELEAAGTAHARALELRPREPEILNMAALLAPGGIDDQKLREALAIDPLRPTLLNNLACYHASQADRGNLAEAETLLRQALSADPLSAKLRRNLIAVIRGQDPLLRLLLQPLRGLIQEAERLDHARQNLATEDSLLLLLWLLLRSVMLPIMNVVFALLVLPVVLVYQLAGNSWWREQAGMRVERWRIPRFASRWVVGIAAPVIYWGLPVALLLRSGHWTAAVFTSWLFFLLVVYAASARQGDHLRPSPDRSATNRPPAPCSRSTPPPLP